MSILFHLQTLRLKKGLPKDMKDKVLTEEIEIRNLLTFSRRVKEESDSGCSQEIRIIKPKRSMM